jgi:hypothetical protein
VVRAIFRSQFSINNSQFLDFGFQFSDCFISPFSLDVVYPNEILANKELVVEERGLEHHVATTSAAQSIGRGSVSRRWGEVEKQRVSYLVNDK